MTRLRSSRGIWAFVVLTLLASIGPALAEPPPSRRDDGDGVAFFESKVRPLLVEHCIDCHGGKKVRSGLSLIHRENALLGGSRGPAIDIERPEKSLLLAAIAYGRDIEMPPRGKLDAPTRAVFKEWIERGAPWTEGEAGRLGDLESEPPKKRELTDKDRQYWAYRPVVRPARPEVRTPGWNEHPVDAFIAARVEGIGLTPAPTADEVTLLRRASYDLTGLPPTTVEVNAYLEDTSPDKWERLIERLLASPRYGEKWGRHWLDLVRYAETNGYERDSTKLNMWRYRDYVIRSFNEDNPYDRFIIEQIAGDELPNGGADGLLATGFHRLPIWDDEPVDRVQSRADVIADILDTSSMAFLGSTLGCARCHDHKKDPFSQRDYYRMMAFFNNIADHGVGKSITKPVQDDERPNEPVWTIAERDAKLAELETNLAPFLSELKREWAAKGRHLEIEQRVVVPTSETERQTWRYTYETPPEGWEAQAFDDSTWSTGSGGFGRKGTPRSVIGTEWTSKDIFIRRTFRVTEIPRYLTIRFHHDEALDV